MTRRRYPLSLTTKLFLGTVAFTLIIWVLRGLTVLAFVPGLLLWILILLCFGVGIFSSLQRMQ